MGLLHALLCPAEAEDMARLLLIIPVAVTVRSFGKSAGRPKQKQQKQKTKQTKTKKILQVEKQTNEKNTS